MKRITRVGIVAVAALVAAAVLVLRSRGALRRSGGTRLRSVPRGL